MITPTSLLYPDAFLSPLAINDAVHRALVEREAARAAV